MTTKVSKVVPFLWYAKEAEEAIRFYVSLIPNSSVDNIWALPADTPGGPSGSVKVVEFTLGGVQFNAMQAGPMDPSTMRFPSSSIATTRPRSTVSGTLWARAAPTRRAAG